ncbi:epsin-1 isoform X2 [Conger conger]|uniref:epsin-1 isoform X2 n=1 Tax=Conger conger TaxID=82655 RepID=UPI002A5A5A0F|nr:epsin-1 isoform X2 [Conger conger]
MSTSSLRRQVKNIVHNYSEAEIKVREATSNDPWGPSSSLMSEIADLTYNVVAFSEIMSMVWKRLNDHGKNWRHVYKAMTLMEYLIKTGSERVAQQCRENIYAVQTLKDFQYIDRDGKDQGVNVREKAKQLVTLLKDEERLREERIHALKTKEKMAQTTSASSAPTAPGLAGAGLGSHTQGSGSGGDPEQAWPQSSGEEDLQLQLALAMSKEEAEQEERLRRGDDLRLQMAIEESKREKAKPEEVCTSLSLFSSRSLSVTCSVCVRRPLPIETPLRLLLSLTWRGVGCCARRPVLTLSLSPSQSSLMELSAVDPWGAPAAPPAVASAGPSPPPTSIAAAASASGPWGPSDPWGATSPTSPVSSDPWGGGGPAVAPPSDPWGDTARVNSDPWGSTAVTPPSSDPWGASVGPTAAPGPSDPWAGDGVPPAVDALTSDPWGGLTKHTTNGTGDPDLRSSTAALGDSGGSTGSPVPFDLSALGSSLPVRKTPESFLGPNAALVDLDSLVSSKPKPKQPPPPSISTASTHNPFLQTQGASTVPGMAVTPGSSISSRGVSPTPPPTSNPFGSTPMASISPQTSSLGLSQLRTSPVPPNPMLGTPHGQMPPPTLGMVQPGMGMPGMGIQMTPPQMGLGMVQSSPMGIPYGGISPMAPAGATILMGAGGPGQPQLILGAGTGGGVLGASGGVGGGAATGGSTNPFLL